MVLSPLPVRPRTILFAKMSLPRRTSLGLAVSNPELPLRSCLALSLFLGRTSRMVLLHSRGLLVHAHRRQRISLRLVLTMQGIMALLLPRRIFLRLSAFLQLAAYGLFLASIFFEPRLPSAAAFAAPQNQRVLASSPSYWFFALFNQTQWHPPAHSHLACTARVDRPWPSPVAGASSPCFFAISAPCAKL